MNCQKCGNKLKGNDRFCPVCGQTVPKSGNKKIKIIAGITAGVLVVGICGGVFAFKSDLFGFSGDNDSDSETLDTVDLEIADETSSTDENVSVESSENESGTISGQVVDDSGNPVENAKVVAVPIDRKTYESSQNSESSETSEDSDAQENNSSEITGVEVSVTTDKDGNYTLVCVVGYYRIEITADGYDDFVSVQYIEVKANSEIPVEAIKIQPDSNSNNGADSGIIDNVINNESKWIGCLNDEDNYIIGIENSEDQAEGNDYFFFQDMDMDGEVELVAVSKYDVLNGDGSDLYRFFTVWDCNDISFSCYKINSSYNYANINYTEKVGVPHDRSNAEVFKYSLWQKSDGSFVYLTYEETESFGSFSKLTLDKQNSETSALLNYMLNFENGTMSFTNGNNGESYSSASEAVEWYNNYFADLTGYKTTTKIIHLDDYQNKSVDEKKKLLQESINAWSYEKDENAEMPLKSVIGSDSSDGNSGGGESSDTVTEDDLKAYVSDFDISNWICEDFNQDGELEAFCAKIKKYGYLGEDEPEVGIPESILYINKNGYKVVDTEFYCEDAFLYRIYTVEYKETKYIAVETGAGGSGFSTNVYYMLGGTVFEASCSGQIDWLDTDGTKIYGCKYTHNGVLSAVDVNLKYIESTKDLIVE